MLNTVFRVPSAKTIAQRQLESAERTLLEHEAHAEFHDAMATMYRDRIERLRDYVGQELGDLPLLAAEVASRSAKEST